MNSPEKGKIYRHTRNHKKYMVTMVDLQVRVNGEWVPGVMYESFTAGGSRVRTLGNFVDAFIPVPLVDKIEDSVKGGVDWNEIPVGIYTVTWTEGDTAQASIYADLDGVRWIAPVTWLKTCKLVEVEPLIKSLDLIRGHVE